MGFEKTQLRASTTRCDRLRRRWLASTTQIGKLERKIRATAKADQPSTCSSRGALLLFAEVRGFREGSGHQGSRFPHRGDGVTRHSFLTSSSLVLDTHTGERGRLPLSGGLWLCERQPVSSRTLASQVLGEELAPLFLEAVEIGLVGDNLTSSAR